MKLFRTREEYERTQRLQKGEAEPKRKFVEYSDCVLRFLVLSKLCVKYFPMSSRASTDTNRWSIIERNFNTQSIGPNKR